MAAVDRRSEPGRPACGEYDGPTPDERRARAARGSNCDRLVTFVGTARLLGLIGLLGLAGFVGGAIVGWPTSACAEPAVHLRTPLADDVSRAPRAPRDSEPVRLEFDTDASVDVDATTAETHGRPSCPSRSAFFESVRVYTSRWSTVEEGQANTLGRTIRVRLSAHGREIIGVLTVADPGGTLSERKIVGPTCPGVARALAIMVGVAIEPHGALETTQDEDHEPATGPSGLAESERSAESAEHAPPENSRTTDRARSSTDRAVEHRASTSRTNWRHGDGVDRPRAPETSASSREPAASSDDARRGFLLHVEAVSVDLRGESTSAVIGGSLPGLAASIAFALQIVDGPRWTRRLRPSVGLGIRRSFPKERSLRGGNVDFEWTAGSLRLCPHTFVAAGVVELSPCVETNVGSLRASADGYADAQRTSVPWLDLGGAMWAAVSLSKHLFLSSTVLVSAPLLRRPFVLASGARPAEIPVLGVLGGLGLGARW